MLWATVTPAINWDIVATTGLNGYYTLAKSATPATPGLGQYGIDQNNTVLVNVGVNPTSGIWYAAVRPPTDVLFEDCEIYDTIDLNGIEGAGLQFDLPGINCRAVRCRSFNNEGHGFVTNIGPTSPKFLDCISVNNVKGGIASLLSTGTLATGNTLVGPGTGTGIWATNGGTVTATNNAISGFATGIAANSALVTVTENYNRIYATTARTLVSAGANSTIGDPLLSVSHRPLPGSPLIGAGKYLGTATDNDGLQRPNPPSIGALEPFQYSARLFNTTTHSG
jgi:hypothetical protein